MNCKNILVAGLNLDIDYTKMTHELLSVMDSDKCVPFSYLAERGSAEEVTAYSLFLRNSADPVEYSYRGAKSGTVDSYNWIELSIPYTKSIIESLPFKQLTAVRVVYFPDVPCVEHTDWDDPTDHQHTLGLSIIPSTAGTWCEVWNEQLNDYVAIPSNAMLLNDSIKHRVPKGIGTRITMRVFGEVDYSWFEDKIIPEHCYYLY
jgi:hypothetical protein